MPDGGAAGAGRPRLLPNQREGLGRILAAAAPNRWFLLTGHAGGGKTTLVVEAVAEFIRRGHAVAASAPTHSAVKVLRRKLHAAGLDEVRPDPAAPPPLRLTSSPAAAAAEPLVLRTVQSLLSLRPRPEGERQVFERAKFAKPVPQDVVVLDEASMAGESIMSLMNRHLRGAFVLFVGDPAQLKPVGEGESHAFSIKDRFHLEGIVRQAEGNPIVAAADAIRRGTGGLDLSWAKDARGPGGTGVFVPRDDEAWLRRAFAGQDFDAAPDRFRYLAWTNDRVARVNRRVRVWRFGGEPETPFVPGEHALFRRPLMRGEDDILVHTNEECRVLEIGPDVFPFRVPAGPRGLAEWTAEIPSWRMTVLREDGEEVECHAPRDPRDPERVKDRIRAEAASSGSRWEHLHRLDGVLALVQPPYAMTLHCAQGATFDYAFLDLGGILRCARRDPDEARRLLYVGASRPSLGLVVVNA